MFGSRGHAVRNQIFSSIIYARLTVGESFFQVSEEEAVEYLEKAVDVSEDFLRKYVDEYDTLRLEMEDLKKSLYAKFGTAINLEDK